jgi:DNA mismatch repair protein MutL
VTDNGSGVASDEVGLAFHRFATSKYPQSGDVFSIETLGFRGEALPSIASVSSIKMVTKCANEEIGTSLLIDNGTFMDMSLVGCSIGTTITVTNLFSELPARLNFLKSRSVESQRIYSMVQQLAMAFPKVSFRLDMDDKVMLNTRGNGDLRNTYAEIFGSGTADLMMIIEDDQDNNYAEIYGLISLPSMTRSNRNHINLIVNGRCIQNRSLVFAIEDAYKGFLTVGRHPLSVLYINIPKEDLDFNVHPAKVEIRLKDERQVFSSIQRLIRHSLISMSPVPYTNLLGIPQITKPDIFDVLDPDASITSYQGSLPLFNAISNHYSEIMFDSEIKNLRLIGQVKGLYIVGETNESMYIIDQHAAHERILYEQVQDETKITSQGILEPIVLTLSGENEQVLNSSLGYWRQCGFDVEHFGSHSYLLRSVPSIIGNVDPGQKFLSILDDLFSDYLSQDWQLKVYASIACHSAVKSGDILSEEEMKELLVVLSSTRQPNHCAHGRPTMIKLDFKDLEKEFKRT